MQQDLDCPRTEWMSTYRAEGAKISRFRGLSGEGRTLGPGKLSAHALCCIQGLFNETEGLGPECDTVVDIHGCLKV